MDIEKELLTLSDWSLSDTQKKITKSYTFPDFAAALTFASAIGRVAEEHNHHPDLSISWGKVVVELSTHSMGSVTEKDIALARAIDEIR